MIQRKIHLKVKQNFFIALLFSFIGFYYQAHAQCSFGYVSCVYCSQCIKNADYQAHLCSAHPVQSGCSSGSSGSSDGSFNFNWAPSTTTPPIAPPESFLPSISSDNYFTGTPLSGTHPSNTLNRLGEEYKQRLISNGSKSDSDKDLLDWYNNQTFNPNSTPALLGGSPMTYDERQRQNLIKRFGANYIDHVNMYGLKDIPMDGIDENNPAGQTYSEKALNYFMGKVPFTALQSAFKDWEVKLTDETFKQLQIGVDALSGKIPLTQEVVDKLGPEIAVMNANNAFATEQVIDKAGEIVKEAGQVVSGEIGVIKADNGLKYLGLNLNDKEVKNNFFVTSIENIEKGKAENTYNQILGTSKTLMELWKQVNE